MMENGWGKERKINSGSATAGERWVERAEAKVFANREHYKNFLITQPLRRACSKLFTFSGNYQDTLRILHYRILQFFPAQLCYFCENFAVSDETADVVDVICVNM
jgi:hypothetical protein